MKYKIILNVIIIFIFIFEINSKSLNQFDYSFYPINLEFDYSNFIIQNSSLLNEFKNEFDVIKNYLKELIYMKPFKNFYENQTKTKIFCKGNKLKRNLNITITNTTMIVYPRIITSKTGLTGKNDFLYYNKCFTDSGITSAIILKIQEKNGNLNYIVSTEKDKLNFRWYLIRILLTSIGFNEETFSFNKINNNIKQYPDSNLQKYNYFWSYKKYKKLLNVESFVKTNEKSNNTGFLRRWPYL